MNRKAGTIRLLLIIFAFMTILLPMWACSTVINNNFILNFEQKGIFSDSPDTMELKSSANENPISYSSIFRNSTSAYRLFESIKFTINASAFLDPNYTIIEIHYSNNMVENFNMDYVLGTNTNFTYTYTPRYNDPLGFQEVSYLIYNVTDGLLSSTVPITNFTINSNYLLSLDKAEYHLNETLYAELIVNDEPQPYDFNWNVTIVDDDNETLQSNLFNVGNNINEFSTVIDDRFNFTNDFYYVKINISDASRNTIAAAYYPFKVLNSAPEIAESSIAFSVDPLKRAEDCTLNLNVTDVDPYTKPENLNVSLVIQDSIGRNGAPIQLTNNGDWTFTTIFSIGIGKPLGYYQMHIGVVDQYGGYDNATKLILIENNPPEIKGYSVNGLNVNQSVSVNYGEDLVFRFNVIDVENTIAYVTVSLLDSDNNWYNITKQYQSGMKIIIRTEELITGVWYVYISVTDRDGATTRLNANYGLAPQEINIIPDVLTPVLPWIALSIGLLIGFLAGVGLLYRKFKRSTSEPKEIPLKKPSKTEKVSSIKKKEPKQAAEEVEKKELEEISKEPQRTIKRKLK
ncbi:MAG: hypothetical protein EAX91_09260 [Candidatus Lokiarchaeota archaeon]|nr:hypothetical protein [Candidatus Lokiarchaeota archaeon]